MTLAQPTYRPRDAEHAVLHAVINEHLETFLREAIERGNGSGLPRFVEDEFREFLTCGVLAHGFARLRCDGCGLDRLLPFSLCRAVLAVYVHALLGFQRRRAGRLGVSDGRSGSLTVIQRFGGALNLNCRARCLA